MINTFYAELDDLKSRLDITDTDDDERLLDAIDEASRALDMACGRKFYPYIAALHFDYDSEFELGLDEDLLSVTTLLTSFDDGSGSEITSSQYWLMCGDSYNTSPYDRIRINRSTTAGFDYNYTPDRSQKITGVWGFHDDYSNAFVDSGKILSGDISASVTSVLVDSLAPFSAGQTIQVGSEWMHIKNTETALTLVVERSINGSTAATHSENDAVYIYEPIRDVKRVASRYALWLYKQDEAPFTFETTTDELGKLIIPKSAPPEVFRFIIKYQRTH